LLALLFLCVLTAATAQPLKAPPATGDPFTLAWTSDESVWTFDVAWGDYDGDGDLDLATGDENFIRLYRNDGGTLTSSAVWYSNDLSHPRGLIWGDVDGDGDLHLAVGRDGGGNVLFVNEHGVLNLVWVSK
jgi:hypothetical protein